MNGVKRNTQTTPANERDALRVAKAQDSTPEELEALVNLAPKIDRALAKHPSAPASVLERLSHSSDRTTRRNVIRNPNCPLDDLLRLAPQFPKDLLLNPSFEWLLAEEPEAFKVLEDKVLIGLLKYKQCPEAYLLWAADHGSESLKLSVATNPESPRPILEKLVKDESSNVAAAASYHRELSPEFSAKALDEAFRGEVARLLADVSPVEACRLWQLDYIGLAQFPALSPGARLAIAGPWWRTSWLLGDLLECAVFGIDERIELALQIAVLESNFARFFSNRRLPADQLAILSHREEASIREAVARNKNCPYETLAELSRDSSEEVRRSVALNPMTPPEMLVTMYAARPTVDIRHALAHNPNTPYEILAKLSCDSSQDVRRTVALDPMTPSDILAAISAARPIVDIRRALAKNPNAPVDVIKTLAQDPSRAVRLGCLRNPSCPPMILSAALDDADNEVCGYLSENPNTPPTVLARLAHHEDEWIAADAAANPSCPIELLESLSRLTDPDRELVVDAVGRNPNCPPRLRQELAKQRESPHRVEQCGADEDQRDRSLSRSDALYPGFLRSIVEKPLTSIWMERQLEALGNDVAPVRAALAAGDILYPAPNVQKAANSHASLVARVIALTQTSLMPDILAKKASSNHRQQRWAVARNPATPPNTLRRLAQDAHRAVAAQAAVTLKRITAKQRDYARVMRDVEPKEISVDHRDLIDELAIRIRKSRANSLLKTVWESALPTRMLWDPSVAPPEFLEGYWTEQQLADFVEIAARSIDPEEFCAAPKMRAVLEENASTAAQRNALASCPDISDECFEKLTKSKSAEVIRRLIMNPKCKREQQERFYDWLLARAEKEYPDYAEWNKRPWIHWTRPAMAAIEAIGRLVVAPGCPRWIRQKWREHPAGSRRLSRREPHPQPRKRPRQVRSKKRKEAASRRADTLLLSTSKKPCVQRDLQEVDFLLAFDRLKVLAEQADGRTVARAARSADFVARIAAAMHPHATEDTLRRLGEDSVPVVREQAILTAARLRQKGI